MAADEKMSIDERYKYLRKMQKRYHKASRQEKNELLDEMQAVTEIRRKSLIRLMKGEMERQPRKRQRGRTYGPQEAHAVGVIAESLDHICAERLQPNLVWMAQHLAEHGELTLTGDLLDKLVGHIARTRSKVAACPQVSPPELAAQFTELFQHLAAAATLDLIRCIRSLTNTCGGTDTNKCTWSSATCPLKMYTSSVAHVWRTTSRHRVAISPLSTGL